jgi:CRISPR-associated protein Cmr3
MTATEFRFLQPLDVLSFRGNKTYGEPGCYGETAVLPWPSVIAGAIRTKILADDGLDFDAFACGAEAHPALGTPQVPGSFRLSALQLARRFPDGRLEVLVAPPADLVIAQAESAGSSAAPEVRLLRPVDLRLLGIGELSSYPLPLFAVLPGPERSKPKGGFWLTENGWRTYLAGTAPAAADLVESARLWTTEPRVGVGLNPATRSAEESRLFTAEVVGLRKRTDDYGDNGRFDVGFLVAIQGATAPEDGPLRMGGDGRAVLLSGTADYRLPEPDYAAIAASGRCRIVLASPGVFPRGWLPTGVEPVAGQRFEFSLHGVRARLAAAAVPRPQVISGWDLASRKPKPAVRVAPAGSVYWLDQLEATPETLRRLVDEGLWSEQALDPQRRAEGFNRIWFAEWASES